MFLTALDRLCPPHGPTSAKMYDTPLNGTSTDIGTERRIDDDHREPSPSTGSKETAIILDAVDGQSHTAECDAPDCDRPGEDVLIIDDEYVRESVRCAKHEKDFLEVSS